MARVTMQLKDLAKRIKKIIRDGGLTAVVPVLLKAVASRLKKYYLHYLRPKFRRSNHVVWYNNVKVKPYRVVDNIIRCNLPPNQGGHSNPSSYEYGICYALRSLLEKGDRIVIVGGGLGVTSVIAANNVGEEGNVLVYEGAKRAVAALNSTLSLNKTVAPVKVYHAIVGTAHRLEGYSGNSDTLRPQDIPDCDVLEMDCEGAELAILERLDQIPRVVIVETHGNDIEVRDTLQSKGYTITHELLAEKSGVEEDKCKSSNIKVLAAKHISGH